MTGNNDWFIICRQVKDLEHINLPLFYEMLKLKRIKLSNNKISHLNLSSFKFTSVPEHCYNLSHLISFQLGESKLKSISDRIGDLSKLQSLVISSEDLKSLPLGITKLKNLNSLALILRFTVLKNFPKEIIEWMENLRKNGCYVFTRPIERQNVRQGT